MSSASSLPATAAATPSAGVAASLAASVFFAGMYYLAAQLAPLNGEQVFGWRVIATLPLTTWWVLHSGSGRAVVQLLVRFTREQPLRLVLLPVSAALLGVQLWMFMWAPLNGYGLAVSLGFFLLPLGLVLAGRVFFAERLSRAQQLATALAAAGVGWEVWRAGELPWPTWVVLVGYTAYFTLRRRLGTDSLAGHWIDMALLLPMAIWTVLYVPQAAALLHTPDGSMGSFLAGEATSPPLSGWDAVMTTPSLHWVIALLGIFSAGGLGFYMLAARALPLGLFGLLSYVEPILLLGVSWWLGERIQPGQEPLYWLIAGSVCVLAAQGVLRLRPSAVRAPPAAS